MLGVLTQQGTEGADLERHRQNRLQIAAADLHVCWRHGHIQKSGVTEDTPDPVRIGDRCMLAEGVYVGSADHDKASRHLVTRSGPVSIGNDVFLGIRSVVLGGVTIGDGATVGAHSVVTRDVAAGSVVAGNPARRIR